MKKLSFLFLLLLTGTLYSQTIYPSHWWAGMQNNKLQVLIKAEKEIPRNKLVFRSTSADVKVIKVHHFTNAKYLAVDLEISKTARPQKFRFEFVGITPGKTVINYELKARSSQNGKTRVMGVTSKDVSYLLMPDRFANGDPSNDAFTNLRDNGSDRNNKFARHGGDIKGVQDHLDYFNDLGITALWFTPVLENDMPKEHEGNNDMAGYHGYWFTDHYRIDPRFGTNEEYKALVNAAHAKGLKIIQDAIYNHVGLWHWMNKDAPDENWINRWPSFTGPNHREETMFDPYGSAFDKNNMVKGWFTSHLPDVNLDNPYVANYLIQNAIWLTEEFGFDGFRIDTYKYCEEPFVNKLNAALAKEFPKLTTFVEAWANTVVANAYFVQNKINTDFKHNAPGAIDFSLCFAMHAGMNQPFGWTEGVNRLYMTLSQDIVYKNPMNNCIFLDNHDMDRIYSVIGEDWNKMKWGLNWLLTMRGIPQLYYGTEILMKNFKNPTDAEVRHDFPGGWANDPQNKFSSTGRSEMENTSFNYVSKLLHFRKNSSAITSGKTMQYVVRNATYVYFRYDEKQTVMVLTNTGNSAYTPDWSIYQERVKGFTKMRNIQTGEIVNLEGYSIPAKEGVVFELLK